MKWREYLISELAKDRSEALTYLEIAIEEYRKDGDVEVFLIALRTFIEATEHANQRRT